MLIQVQKVFHVHSLDKEMDLYYWTMFGVILENPHYFNVNTEECIAIIVIIQKMQV